jgi:hypothetical protein
MFDFVFFLDGLGQLTDGILAGDDYRLSDNVQGIGQIGYDWIGWKRRSSLNFLFHFSTLKNLTTIRFHTSNLFTRDIYIFNSILITNCENKTNKTFIIIPEDYKNIQARFINISLGFGYGILTKCLKITLTFNNRSKWILISEIIFDSKPIINHIPSPPLIGKNRVCVRVFLYTKNSIIYLDTAVKTIRYWHWLLLASSILILLIVLLIFIYIQWIQTSRQQRKLHK